MPYRGPEGFSWHSSDVSTRRRALAAVVLLGAGWAIGFFAGRMSAWLVPVGNTNSVALVNTTAAPAARTASAPPRPAESPQRDTPQTSSAAPQAPASAPESSTATPSSPDAKTASRTAPSANERAGTEPNKTPPAAETSTSTAQSAGPSPDTTEPGPAQRAAKAEPSGGAINKADREQDIAKSPDRDVGLVNPEWKQAPGSKSPRESEPEPRAYGAEPEPERGRFADDAALAKCEGRYSSFRRSDGTYQPYGRSSRELCPFLSDMPRRPPY